MSVFPFSLLDRLESLQALDPIAARLRSVVQVAVPDPVGDTLHGVWLGHPVHPVAVQLPIGAWTSATLLDLAGGAASARAADLLAAVGTASALPAIAAGLEDWATLNPADQRTGLVHASVNAFGFTAWAMSLAARRHGHRFRGRVYGLVGLLAVTVGGTIGSHLSYRRSVGANHNADAPDLAPADWTPVARLADLPDGQMTVRQAGIFPVLLLRRGDEVLAIANRCSHQSGPLHEGELVQAGDNGPCVICPWHGSTFRLRDGGVLHGPAVHPQPKLETQLDDEGRVLVRLAVEATAH